MSHNRLIEISFGRSKRRITAPETYLELKEKVKELFGDSLPDSYRFFYRDNEGELIYTSTQNDYEIAVQLVTEVNFLEMLVVPNLKKDNCSPKFHVPSFTAIKMQNTSLILREHLETEEIKPKSPLKEPVEEKKNIDRELSKFRAGNRCLTCPNLPEENEYSEIFDENNTPGKHENNSDQVQCLACNGRKINKKGKPCKKCTGTGFMNLSLKKFIEKTIQKAIQEALSHENAKKSTPKPQEPVKPTPTRNNPWIDYHRRENQRQRKCPCEENCTGCCIF